VRFSLFAASAVPSVGKGRDGEGAGRGIGRAILPIAYNQLARRSQMLSPSCANVPRRANVKKLALCQDKVNATGRGQAVTLREGNEG